MTRRSRSSGRTGGSGDDSLGRRGALLVSLALLAFALALPFLERRLGPRVRNHVVDPGRVRVLTSPAVLEPQVVEQVAQSLARLPAVSLQDEHGIAELTEALPRASAWIRHVVAAYKRYPNELEVHVDVRRPVAMVASGGASWLVDEQKVIAPVHEAMGLVQRDRLPLVTLEENPPASLELGPGLDIPTPLAKGVEVALELRPHLAELAARGIEIALIQVRARTPAGTPDGRISEVDLYTPLGLVIEWGRPRSGPLQSLEPSPETKVSHLLRAAARYPGLAGIKLLRVQFEKADQVSLEWDPARPAGWAMDRSDTFNMP